MQAVSSGSASASGMFTQLKRPGTPHTDPSTDWSISYLILRTQYEQCVPVLG